MDYEAVIRQAMEKLGYGIGDVSSPQGVGITADDEPEQAGQYTFSGGSAENAILAEADMVTEGLGSDLHITDPDRWSGTEGGTVGGGLGGRFEAFTIGVDTAERYRDSAKYMPHGGSDGIDAPDDAAYLIAELLNNERGSTSQIVSDKSGFQSGTTSIEFHWDAKEQPDGSVVVYLRASVDRGEIR